MMHYLLIIPHMEQSELMVDRSHIITGQCFAQEVSGRAAHWYVRLVLMPAS